MISLLGWISSEIICPLRLYLLWRLSLVSRRSFHWDYLFHGDYLSFWGRFFIWGLLYLFSDEFWEWLPSADYLFQRIISSLEDDLYSEDDLHYKVSLVSKILYLWTDFSSWMISPLGWSLAGVHIYIIRSVNKICIFKGTQNMMIQYRIGLNLARKKREQKLPGN